MQETSQEIKQIVKELISRDMIEAKNSVNVWITKSIHSQDS
jgi:hypothetical protein